jgi:hypothetical protein
MHTLIVTGAGFALLGVCLAIGRLIGGGGRAPLATAARSFVPLWFVASVLNMSVGVLGAGYSVADELPIFALVFAAPAAIALFLAWRLSRAPPPG